MNAILKPRIRVKAGSERASAQVPEVETAHHAASLLARDMQTWPSARLSADAALLPELDTIAGRVEDLARNNGIAAGAERTLVDNVVGPRVICKPNPDRVALGGDDAGKTSDWAAEWGREVEAQFRTFTNTDWFDAGLRLDFHLATRLAARTLARSGEVLALPLFLSDRGSKWFTCLQLVDPARLSNPMNRQNTNELRAGIELDQYGAATAYHIRKGHPGDVSRGIGLMITGEWDRIPAYQPWGRRRVLHLYDPEQVGQTRGKAVVTSVARNFKMLDHYMREELRLAVLNSLVFAALETPLDQKTIVEMFGGAEDPMGAYQEALGEWRVQMKGGAMIPLPPGTSMKPFAPQRSVSGLDSFATVMLRGIGAGLNMPYELVLKDFSKTNYSSARAALTEAWRYFTAVRQLIVDRWCALIYDLWFEEAVNRDLIPDCTPADYYANQTAWTQATWIFAGRGWIDPFKEARAAETRLNTGVSTLADEAGEQGRDWREQIEQRAREQAYARELGLEPPAPAPMSTEEERALLNSNDEQTDGDEEDEQDA